MRRSRQKPNWVKTIADENIARLLALAEKFATSDKKLSQRYCRLAKAFSRRYKARIPPEIKCRICPGCSIFLIPGKNAKARKKPGKPPAISYLCMECGSFSRLYMPKEGKALKRKKTEK